MTLSLREIHRYDFELKWLKCEKHVATSRVCIVPTFETNEKCRFRLILLVVLVMIVFFHEAERKGSAFSLSDEKQMRMLLKLLQCCF